MYTQCPKCETVFHITLEQLKGHDGVVRCGRCDHVFSADQQLFSDIPSNATEKPAVDKKPRDENPVKAKPIKPKPPGPRTQKAKNPEPPAEEVEAAPAPWSPPVEPKAPRERARHTSKDAIDALETPAHPLPSRRFSALWSVGIVLLAAMLVAQSAYFYRDQLAAYPELRPTLDEICAQLGCQVQPPYDAGRIELVQPTAIAPHPRIANALRLRATLVNRADKVQAHPYMQVTLTDNAGRILARRVFSPHQYLEQRATPGTGMPPHLAVSALIDITNPDGKAVGYQIDFLPPPASRG
ncbi:MAG TPA: DUF3426 domain-containing protein [Burkholderiales bacterium]|nr:DUF3426 domain-containing protein [Burkholderiales bacterium]